MAITRGNVTIAGFVGSDPIKRGTEEFPVTAFRLGSNRRRFNKTTQQWVDYPTTWITVKAFRNLAENAHTSIQKGDSVLVTGLLTTEQWATEQGEERTRTVIEASNIGHDLNFGTTHLKKIVRAKSDNEANGESAGTSSAAAGISSDPVKLGVSSQDDSSTNEEGDADDFASPSPEDEF